MAPRTEFPPIRACLFDMDGLLLNTEDMYTLCANHVLSQHHRPPLPWSIKAKLMGVPGGSTSPIFMNWAQLPISREQYAAEQKEQQKIHFPTCEALPGVETLLRELSTASSLASCDGDGGGDGKGSSRSRVHLALATSSERGNFELKTRKRTTQELFSVFAEARRVLGDDERVGKGRGKPAPDIYLLALKLINDTLGEGEQPVKPEECLVFEDSVPGVEAGRRAGMRVVWVPHEGLRGEYRGLEGRVLAGRMGMMVGEEEQLGEIDDGWARMLPSLEDFPYGDYGIVVA